MKYNMYVQRCSRAQGSRCFPTKLSNFYYLFSVVKIQINIFASKKRLFVSLKINNFKEL